MSTKIDGDGCYDAALPDEPMFVLLARDESAPKFVREWCAIRQSLISAGIKPESDQAQIDEAYALADRMEAWRASANEAWRDRKTIETRNSEREAAVAYASNRIAQYKARGYNEAAHALGVLVGDMEAGFHIEGAEARSPFDTLGDSLAAHDAFHDVTVQHTPQRQGDENFCPKCTKRWAVDEDAPETCA